MTGTDLMMMSSLRERREVHNFVDVGRRKEKGLPALGE